MEHINPFALVRASDYTDEQINSLWVELGQSAIERIIEPQSRISKFILGGKGTGKTHLLRYHSYQVARLRNSKCDGISILKKQKYLAIFYRAHNLDSKRFEESGGITNKWQQLFAIYFELRLAEGVLEALCDIKTSSGKVTFNDSAFIAKITEYIVECSLPECRSIGDFRDWVVQERRRIDEAVNNYAFTGSLDIRILFSIGSLCIPIARAAAEWHAIFKQIPLIYLIDEIENFSILQQQVVNSLIRYGEGLATFRLTGRLYSRKTFSTLADGEENREGAEFKTTFLDDILRSYPKYPDFARKFVINRLSSFGLIAQSSQFEPTACFTEISTCDYYSAAIENLRFDEPDPSFIRVFVDALKLADIKEKSPIEICSTLTKGLPIVLQKLNLLQFCKKYKRGSSGMSLAKKIHGDSINFLSKNSGHSTSYKTAYGHWATDIFAQLCRDSKNLSGVPYAGFDTFVKMSSGNPRNLLIILGKAYEIAAFKEVDFVNGPALSIQIQTLAAEEAARYFFESDTNYGSQAEQARVAIERLASILRTARYALNIPEKSPLAVSFFEGDLSENSKNTLNSALNYSLVFEMSDGRPDRNSQRLNKKIQLNPLLSPRWGLPISVGGDIPLNRDLVNAVFDLQDKKAFGLLLKALEVRWNNPFKNITTDTKQQIELF